MNDNEFLAYLQLANLALTMLIVFGWVLTVKKLRAMRAKKDGAYFERNNVVALLAKWALAHGYKAGLKRTNIDGWNPEWHGCVYIDFPTGQASWHYHDSQAFLFEGLPPYDGEYDGHTTQAKYANLVAMGGFLAKHKPAEGSQ